ncbi:MAG: nitroreductase family protein [Methermicoccaceae archaeon]
MDVLEAIAERRSIRSYTGEHVSDAQVDVLVRAGQDAPSAGNLQARDFIVVRDATTKKRLAMASLGQVQVERADVLIVVCANVPRSSSRYGKRGTLYAHQDAAASVQNMLIAAHALGLGACWVGAFDEHEVGHILGVPVNVVPCAIITVGVPAEKPKKPRRFTTENVHVEVW